MNRSAFNQIWAQRAKKAGVDFHFDCNLRGIVREKGRVTAEIYRHGETLSLRAAPSSLPPVSAHGCLIISASVPPAILPWAQAVVATDINEVEVYFGSEVAPGFFGWLVPTSPGKGLVGLLARGDNPFYLRKLLASLAAEGKIACDDVPLTYGGVPLKPLPRTCGDNLLVVGTAAGQVKPITGGGIYFGLICADIAANHLQKALAADNLTARGLAGYERAWRRKLARELRHGYWGRKVYEMLNDRQVNRVFGLMESTGIIEELRRSEDLSFDWHADVITRVMRQQLLAKTFSSIKEPFSRKKPAGSAG